MRSFSPLYHILLMCFLKDSVNGFVSSVLSENPLENKTHTCENPVCPHYHAGGIAHTDAQYYNGGVKGFFRCSYCGMRYMVNIYTRNPNGTPYIVDYGDLWVKELQRCIQEKKTLDETAEIFKCSKYAIAYQKKKHGLTKPTPYDPGVGPDKYYKMQILELGKKYAEVSVALIREQIANAYHYLFRHDQEWLQAHIVNKKDLYQEYDLWLLDKVKDAVQKIKTDGNEERRLTLGYIAKTAGIDLYCLRCLVRKPRTQAYVESVIESEVDCIRRRTVSALRRMKADGVPFYITTLEHYMRAHHYTYVKHKELIDALVMDIYYR